MHGNRDSFMLPVDAADNLGQVRFYFSERHGLHDLKYDQFYSARKPRRIAHQLDRIAN